MEPNQLDDYDLIAKALLYDTLPKNRNIKKSVSIETPFQSNEIMITKIGCDYSNQTLLIQFYSNKTTTQIKTKKIHIKKFIYKDPKQILESLKGKIPEYLGPSVLNDDTIVENALRKLLFRRKNEDTENNKLLLSKSVTTGFFPTQMENTKNPSNYSSNNEKKLPTKKIDEIDPDVLLHEIDLNKCSDELNQKAKQLMDQEFETKRLKPGDEGFVWDKQIDFGPFVEENEWDEDDDDE